MMTDRELAVATFKPSAALHHAVTGKAFEAYPRFTSIASQIFAATSGPPSRAMPRMPVGEVTLISVRLPSIPSMHRPTARAAIV